MHRFYHSAPIAVQRAVESDHAELVPVLARAFANDPLTRWFVLDDQRREERLRRLFAWYLRLALPLGQSHTTSDRSAAALWMPPGRWKLSLLRQLLLLPEIVRVVGLRRLPTRMHGVDAIQKKHPAAPHYYLAVLGTEPERQGQGLGSAVLAEGVRRCDRTRMPAYLETATERNLPLYERHGFRVTGEVRVPYAGPRVWLMWRLPGGT